MLFRSQLTATEPIVEEVKAPTDLDVGSKFLLGVKLKNLNRATFAANGLYNMTSALYYKDEYVSLLNMSNTEAIERIQLYLGFKNKTPLLGRGSSLKMGYGSSFGKGVKVGDEQKYLITLLSLQYEPLLSGYYRNNAWRHLRYNL